MTTHATRSPRRRTVVALAVVLAILAAFVVRLVDIQVVNASDHVADAEKLATGAGQTLYGARGEIVDTNGTVLATSTILYDVNITPMLAVLGTDKKDADGKVVKDANGDAEKVPWPELAAQIGEVTGQSADDIEKIVADALAIDEKSQFATIKRYVSTEEYRALVDLGLPFLYFDQHPSRVYPDGAVAGNILGFVGSDGTPLEGIESLQNSCLQSENGSVSYQRAPTASSSPAPRPRRPPSTAARCNSRSTATCSGTCSN